jgi:hypothetical protein
VLHQSAFRACAMQQILVTAPASVLMTPRHLKDSYATSRSLIWPLPDCVPGDAWTCRERGR